jgi:(R,R)-butanediol dehydrogenase/meso-butanediol dehydrogenase/diacetyl reductase
MRAALFQAVGEPLCIERLPDPRPAADQVIVQVAGAGICGSDLHMSEYGVVPAGTIFGHEFAGTIVELGSAVSGAWKIGDRVTALPIQACHDCDACAAHLPALCRAGLFTGTNLTYPGAYAEYVGARANMLQRLPLRDERRAAPMLHASGKALPGPLPALRAAEAAVRTLALL